MASRMLLALAFSVALVPRSSAEPDPIGAFGHLPSETDAVLSPDGRYLAWQDHKEPVPRVIVYDLGAKRTQRILAVPERTKLRRLVWQDSETVLVVVSSTVEPRSIEHTAGELFRTFAYDASGGDGRILPKDYGKNDGWHPRVPPLADLVAAHISKAHTVMMVPSDCGACLLEVDTRTGLGKVVKYGNQFTVGWIVDHNGKPVVRADWDWRGKQYRVLALFGDDVKEILRTDDGSWPVLTSLVPDGSAVVLLAPNGKGHQSAWALPLNGGPRTLLSEEPDVDITGVYEDPWTGAVTGFITGGLKPADKWANPASQHRFDVLQQTFPDKIVWIADLTADGKQVLVSVESPSAPVVYYLVDFATHHADIAAEEYPALSTVKMGTVRAMTYKAHDGTTIPAYVTTPPGADSLPRPMVVLPHGGPHSRDEFGFDWLSQFLASLGYVVFQPQFRGSTGFGTAFEEAGYRQWGGLMQDDITDGVRQLIQDGIADPDRVGIVGASYGGYAALAGAAFTPDVYRCAVSINGVSDLPALMREQVPLFETTSSTALDYWKKHIGGPNDRILADKSPINSVSSIRIPVLLVYGSGDGVVPMSQSEAMARKLRSARKSVAVVTLRGDDHWLSHSESRIQLLTALEEFLKTNL